MQEKVQLNASELVAVDILSFRTAVRDITFNVYLQLSKDNFARVFSGSTGLDYKRLSQYIAKGVSELYIHKEDTEKYKKFVSVTAKDIYQDPDTPIEKKIAALLNMTEQNISEVFSQVQIGNETAKNTKKIIHNYIELMTERPDTLPIILKLVSHGDYLYYHSIAVSIFGMIIAKSTGIFNQQMVEIIGLGGLLHDIGFSQLPEEILQTDPHELTGEQRKQLQSHPKLGLRMLEAAQSIPEEVRYIVYQHHEEPSGRGYPNGIRGSVIYYPAKVIAIADGFSDLISTRPYRPAYSVKEAIQMIKKSVGKYDKELTRLLPVIFLRSTSKAREVA